MIWPNKLKDIEAYFNKVINDWLFKTYLNIMIFILFMFIANN